MLPLDSFLDLLVASVDSEIVVGLETSAILLKFIVSEESPWTPWILKALTGYSVGWLCLLKSD